jgi:LysM repeat protein
MEPRSSGISARVLAPAALVVCALLFLLVIATSGGGNDDEKKSDSSSNQTQSSRTTTKESKPKRASGSTYTVKTGDTLGTISEKTGVNVEQLQELNPDLDPQALVAGQKLKTR